jgi:meiotically up-regulated gene 157 (Mug157) protein
MKRRQFLTTSAILGAGSLLPPAFGRLASGSFPEVRVPLSERKFTSPAIEEVIAGMRKAIRDPELAWMFGNCFPNTLDTTVDHGLLDGKPDTYVITGDIDAMWLRDSSAQVWPYLPFMKNDPRLQQLIEGVIRRQVRCIHLDPYANAFYKDPGRISEWKDDVTLMKAGIHERKWEIDSLCYPIRLAHGYWKKSGDLSVFDNYWKEAMELVIKTFREQQRMKDEGPYKFERKTTWATDGVAMGGYGYPAKKIGLIHSMFRPSDDATVFPFLVPSNFFAAASLKQLSEICGAAGYIQLANEAASFSKELLTVLKTSATTQHPIAGKIYAYEVNGSGSVNLMDDANIPSLLSLPYLTPGVIDNETWQRTRKILWSEANPFFFKGRSGEGIGGPHAGRDQIWPMSIIMFGLTSKSQGEVSACLRQLKATHAGTGFIHESFHKDDPSRYTRKWFAWANTLLGEFLLQAREQWPRVLVA